ncbi:hypothetical protein KJ039_02470 [bacterium]|nr:hypothetical protein [bacterium]
MMRADRIPVFGFKRQGAGSSGAGGYSLIEILIAIFITGVVAVSIYSLYNTFFIQSHTQDLKVEAQQNARVALNLMEREIMNAGYAACDGNVIQEATATSIQFVYTDPEEDAGLSATAGQCLRVRYALQTLNGVQVLARRADTGGESGWTAGTTELVAEHVDNIVFSYYDMDGNPVNTSTQAGRNEIRFVSVNLVTKTKSVIQGTGAPATFMSETNIRLRNLGVGASASDNTPPVQTTGLQVRDPGVCGRLKVKWTKNTEGDVRGYKIYYGVASGSYEGVVNIPMTVLSGNQYSCTDNGTEIECTINPSNPPLANSPADGSSTTTYYLTIKAYDNALNHSDPAAEVSGNPDPSSSEFDAGADDSTLNSISPVPVTGFSGADGPSDGQVLLSWTPYDTSTNPDVTGFRIYRSASPFTSYPIDPAADGIDWIAGEPGSGKAEVGKNATSYIDPGPGLIGCRIYYYAIAPVACDSTLLTDSGGEFKYDNDDYDATCGDGEEPCTPGTGFAAVSGSDTAPPDNEPPGTPAISKRPDGTIVSGYKRTYLTFTNPSDADFEHTRIYYSTTGYPSVDVSPSSSTYGVISGGNPVPDTNEDPPSVRGRFISGGATVSFVHDNEYPAGPESVELMHAPELEAAGYYYLAVAYDLCGNPKADASSAQTLAELCGDGQPGDAEWGAPSAPTSAAVSGCYMGTGGGITVIWDAITSDASVNPDAAGYRIYRSPTATFDTANNPNILNNTYCSSSSDPEVPCYLGFVPIGSPTTFSDNYGSDGSTYSYGIVSTDCVYENRWIASGESVFQNNRSSWLTFNGVTSNGVSPGKLLKDNKEPVADEDLAKHKEVLTGIVLDSSGDSSPASNLKHNTVTMFLQNSGSGTVTITGASVSWENSSAYLAEISIGGGGSGIGTTSTSLGAGLSDAVPGPTYTRGVTSVSLTNVDIPGGSTNVPVSFDFRDSGGNPVDMRVGQLLVTFTTTNKSTGSSCFSPLTVSMSPESIYVPLGPSVADTQQNKPVSPVFGYPVPGAEGLNELQSGVDSPIVVDPGTIVTISASITGNTTSAATGNKVPAESATLYYTATAKTVTTPPASGYTEVDMVHIAGNIWSAPIPASDGQRVWYYVVGTDEDGNWDRDPEISHGAYVYDQKEFSVCAVTPSAPTGLAVTSKAGSSVTLAWNAVTTYASGAAIDADDDAILYRIYRNGAQVGSAQAGTSYTDTVPSNGVYSYTVRALNSCADPGPKVSSDSNTAATCVGMSGQATISVSPATIYRGQSFTVTVVDCLALSTGYETTQQTLNVDSGFSTFYVRSQVPHTYSPPVTETGVATGTFVKTIETSASSEAGKLQTLASDTITAFYSYASDTATVSVVPDPCTNTPRAPASISGAVSGQNMTLNWSAVSFNTDDTAITDLAGYRVYEKVCNNGAPNCTGSDIQKDWFLRTTVAAGSTSIIMGADQGNLNQRMYHFRVTAFDSCSTPKESSPSSVWYE